MKVRMTNHFSKWLRKLDKSQKIKVVARLERIYEKDQFGQWRDLGDGLKELKFRSGLRIYYLLYEDIIVLLLAGGGKDEQQRQITQLKKNIRNEH